jgi:hypothetical protein
LYELEITGGKVMGGDDAESASFYPMDDLPALAFDHHLMIGKAMEPPGR